MALGRSWKKGSWFEPYVGEVQGRNKEGVIMTWEDPMAKPYESYKKVIVESFKISGSGLHGDVHIRPITGQGYDRGIRVECSKKLSKDYPVGTRFKIKAKLTDKDGGSEFLYSYFGWKFEVLTKPQDAA